MTTALVIGFGPFPGAPSNPSAELVRALARRRRPALAGVKIRSAVLPTTYESVGRELPALLMRHDPDVVLFFGLASRAKFVRVESRAVNAASVVHADALRAKSPARKIIDGAPSALSVLAPLQRVYAAVRSTGVKVRHSRDAGRYICNAALFTGLDLARRSSRPRHVAFIHIPQPRRRGRINELIRAGEAVLVALVSADRHG
jgi:pyroglutamyl-peptidase